MFTPSQHDVRQFFCETHRKYHANHILTPLEAIARDWLVEHPEYDKLLSDSETALAADYSIERGQSNPFLHLSMHLSITEQISIDQPKGIRAAFLALAQRFNSEHEAHHQIMECLGEMIWNSQRTGLPPDGMAYLECVQRR
jgi:ATP sulfurylase